MAMDMGLRLEQRQKLMMTQELRQALTVLQLPLPELADYLEETLAENPVLEIDENVTTEKEGQSDEEPDAPRELEWIEHLVDRSDLGIPPERPVRTSEIPITERGTAVEGPSLEEHLLLQLHMATSDADLLRAGGFIIGNLDERGYLGMKLEEIAQFSGVGKEVIEPALLLIQSFDPAGIAARNVSECLLIQLRQQGLGNSLAERIILEQIGDLADYRISRLVEYFGVTATEIQAAIDQVRQLNPKPGLAYGGEAIRYVVPDVIVERINEDYIVLVNDSGLPKLWVNPYYQGLLGKPELPDDTRLYIEQKARAAIWIMRSIEQRRLTLYKVTEAIIAVQREFLDRGIRYLHPLTLREVAEIIGMHESTVSRATAGKYVQTPQGVFELRFFFSSGVSTRKGVGGSSTSIQKMIEDLIALEDSRRPLSDQDLAEQLQHSGVAISRRTVAKYREELRIPASSKRRRY